MKKKVLSGILVILVMISTIFMEVSAVVVNQQVQNINGVQNESTTKSEVKENGVNKLAENSLNTVKENSTSEEVEHAQNSLNKAEGNATKQETESNEKLVEDEENRAEGNEEKAENSEEGENTQEKEENSKGNETKEEREEKPSIGEKEDYITEDDLIYSNKYLVKGKVIYRIDPKTSIEEFRKNIEIAEGQEIKIYKGKKEITRGNIGTGMKIKGTNGEEYETSVIGDISRRRNSKSNRTNNDNKTHNKLKRMGTRRNRKSISRHKPETEK